MSLRTALKAMHREAVDFERAMEDISHRGERIASRTSWIIRGVVMLALVAGLSIFYLTYLLVDDMKLLAGDMVNMYRQFGAMTDHVTQMDKSVVEMGGHVGGIPLIAKDMESMSRSVGSMQRSVAQMDDAVAQMDANMVVVTNGVHDMAGRFGVLTHNVEGMSWNVNQMRQPTDMLPPFMGR